MYRLVSWTVSAASDASFLVENWQRVKSFLDGPWAMLLALALIAYAVFRPEPKPEPMAIVPTPSTQVPTDAQSATRVFVNVTPEYLAGLFKDQTSVQGQKLVSVYVGKWIRVSGEIDDVSSIGKDATLVYFWRRPVIIMHFRGETWIDRVSVLRKGDPITVVGQIDVVRSSMMDLENCELIGSSSETD